MNNAQSKREITAFIFDFDGVIVNSEQAVYLGWKKLIDEMQLSGFSLEYFRSLFGSGARNVASQILLKNNILPTPDMVQEIVSKKAAYGGEFLHTAPLIPHLCDLFQRFPYIRRSLVTGNNKLFVNTALRYHDIEKYFEIKIYAEDVAKHKPDPEAFFFAAKSLNVAPSNCLVFEDTEPGIQAANAAGMKSIAITTTRKREALVEATVVIDSYNEVTPQLLSNLAYL